MTYSPKPIDTEHISVPEALLPLVEQLARNVHENWASKRLGEGWSHGRQRNDHLKTTPCLVPYGELPAEEQDYDRMVATETIKAILAFGFRIERDQA